MPARKNKINLKDMQKQISPEELQFNKWYYSNMERLGLLIDLEERAVDNIYPFKNLQEYNKAKTEATKYLMNGQAVPKELEEKLLQMKKLKDK